ncbi:MFS transporter [Sphingobium indicum]|uniref:MFS transporter n=1 Tax=Sphingobium TaxID=165695 RepID=UPI0003877A27|nr:MFS transporter [Sphingobium sp. HDIP04]EQB06453.1 MFS transporter [Sphingobium sp. HDIP04]
MTALAAPAAAAPSSAATGRLLVAGIILSSLTEAVAGTLLALGRADIIGDTSATPDEFAWLDVGYTAFKFIGFAFAPWLLTRIDPRGLLLVATLAMGAACAGAASTTQLDFLIVLRMVQGIAGATLLISGQAILFWNFPAARQPILQAMFAMGSVVAPATAAPLFEGWLVDNHDWRWIFFAVLPLSLGAAGLLLIADPTPARPAPPRRLDWVGLLGLGMALSCATYVLTQGSRWDWFEASRIGWMTAVAAAGLLLFAVRQYRVGSGRILDPSAFRTADFAFAFFVSFIAGAALFGSGFVIPAFAVSVLGFTPTEAGALLLPSGGCFLATLLLAAWLMQARGVPPVATVPFGILSIMTAMWMLSGSNGQSGAADMMPAVLLRGFGLGFLFLSIMLIAFGKLPPASVAFGIGIFNIGRQLGGLIGVAALQTSIDDGMVHNQAVLGAAIHAGSPALAERIGATTDLLVSRGVEASVAAKAATAMVGRAVGGQGAVIAFDTAFTLVALLFVFGAPCILAFKILLAKTMGKPKSFPAEARS